MHSNSHQEKKGKKKKGKYQKSEGTDGIYLPAGALPTQYLDNNDEISREEEKDVQSVSRQTANLASHVLFKAREGKKGRKKVMICSCLP